jgi:hypothetical protein
VPRSLDYSSTPPLPWWRREWSTRANRLAGLALLAFVAAAVAYPWLARYRATGRWDAGPTFSPRTDGPAPKIGPPDRGPAMAEPAVVD